MKGQIMDPDVTLELIINAINDGDVITAREHMENLDEWINRGGYVPVNYAHVVERVESYALETEEMINEVTNNV